MNFHQEQEWGSVSQNISLTNPQLTDVSAKYAKVNTNYCYFLKNFWQLLENNTEIDLRLNI